MWVWIRVGDAGDYEPFDTLADAIDWLNELRVGQIDHFRYGGFDTVNYWGEDDVSCFWGNESAELVRGLDAIEQAALEHELDPAFI